MLRVGVSGKCSTFLKRQFPCPLEVPTGDARNAYLPKITLIPWGNGTHHDIGSQVLCCNNKLSGMDTASIHIRDVMARRRLNRTRVQERLAVPLHGVYLNNASARSI